MSRTKTIYFLSALVLIIGCYALNLSYSLFVDREEHSLLSTNVPVLSYSLENSTYTIPANSSELIELKVINSGTSDINYGISVSDTKGTTIKLVETYNITGKLNASTIEGETTSKEVLVYVTNPTDEEITDLTFNLTSNYTTISFDEDTFINSSNIDCVNIVKLLNNTIIARAKSITESDSKELGYAMYSDTLRTTPAEEVNEADESLLLTTEDDYTATTGNPSYYYRGNVKDNFVNFAGMCWRIVRIEGDKSVKLLLEDAYAECDDDETEITPETYTGNWSDGNTYVFGYDSNNRANFLNYSGGLADSFQSFQSSLAKKINVDITDSSTQNEINLVLSSKLKIDEWCYDDEVTETKSWGFNEDFEQDYTLNDFTDEYYGAYTRIETNKKPSLSCTGTKLTSFRDGTNMYVSTLTADEIVYAGGKSGASNYNYYLMNNYSKYGSEGLRFWSLSLHLYEDDGRDYAFLLKDGGFNISGYYSVFYDSNSRPAVTIKSGSVITGGVGTLENPYIIG